MKSLLPVLLLLSVSFSVFAQSESVDGQYEVVLMSLSESSNVDAMLLKFNEMGYDVEIREVNVNDKYFSRLTLDGFESLQNARASAELMKDLLDNDSIWVNKL
jgi:hypothetical protein